MHFFSYHSIGYGTLIFVYSAVGLLIMYGLFFLLRRFCPNLIAEDVDSDFIAGLHAALFTITFLTLGYSLANVSETIDKYQQDVATEANNIKELDLQLALYGAEKTHLFREDLRKYANSIVEDEWPKMTKGQGSEITLNLQRQLRKDLQELNPTTGKELAVYSEAIKTLGKVVQARSNRVSNSGNSLNSLFFLTNNVGYLGVLIISALMLTQFTWIRFVALNIQVLCVSFIFASSIVLDNPFTGSEKISPEPISIVAKAAINPY